jgi:hypothetical protein
MGTGVSTNVAGALYQQLFTLIKNDYQPTATIQVGIPRLGQNTVDAFTYKGCSASSFELSLGAADVLKARTSWTAREMDDAVGYATPSYAAGVDLLSFVGATLVAGGTLTVPTTTALGSISGGTTLANIRDFSIAVDQSHDSAGYNIGGAGKRSRPPAVGKAEVTGSMTADYDVTTYKNAVRDGSTLALVATFLGPTDITVGNKPTLQIVLPDIRLDGELPKSNGGDVIAQALSFKAYDNLVAAEPLYIATRTADTAL